MVKSGKNIFLKILIYFVATLITAGVGLSIWFSHNYKQIIKDHLSAAIYKSSDSLYHFTFNDINVKLTAGALSLTGVKLWPDETQANVLRQRHRYFHTTLSTIYIPELEADGISWRDLFSDKSLNCKGITVHDIKWDMEARPNPDDGLPIQDNSSRSRVTSAQVSFVNPCITYHFMGPNEDFTFFFKGGNAMLNKCGFYVNQKIDTSVFLYANSGKVRFDSVVFLKKTGRYGVEKPTLDFFCGANSVTLKGVGIRNMINRDVNTLAEKEIYNLDLPGIQMIGFNWNRLIMEGKLFISQLNATEPLIDIHFLREYASDVVRMNKYPHQLLLKAGIEINIKALEAKEGKFKYTEVIDKNNEAPIEFDNIHGTFSNITNVLPEIQNNKSCIVKLEGKFLGKSEVSSTFNLSLADTVGSFTMDGYVTNLDGDDILKQAQALTIVEVTSFHLSRMDMHISGDQRNANGKFTVIYKDLKLSLLKFKSNMRKGKDGPMAFLGKELLFFPDNPMPGHEVRTVTTSFARDPNQGFINLIWKNMYRAAKKTAVRDETFVDVTDGKENGNHAPPKKKGFFKRLFGKHKKGEK